jgi:hypothetical protein
MNTNQFFRSLQPPGFFQSGTPLQQGFGLQSGNPYQQAFAPRAAGQFALQNIFQQQIAYQQVQAMKRQLRRQRQLAAIAQRKAAAADDALGELNAAVAARAQ